MIHVAWLGLALLAGVIPATPPSARLQVLVRLERGAHVGEGLMSGVAAGMQAIWRPYGVDIVLAPAAGDMSGMPAGADEAVRLVITDRLPPSAGGSRDGLGWIQFPAPERPEPAFAVSAAAAWNLVRQATWAGAPIVSLPASVTDRFLAHALSRAAAHELGHYLLRSPRHARSGLMRRGFTIAEIMDESLAPYRLEPWQIAGLERRLAAVRIGSPRATS